MIIAKAQSFGDTFQSVVCGCCKSKDVLVVFNHDDTISIRCPECGFESRLDEGDYL